MPSPRAALPEALEDFLGTDPGGAASFDLLRALTSHTPVGVFLSDAEGSCRFVNERWCVLTGLSHEEALGDGWASALHPDDRDRVTAEWARAAAEKRDSVVEYRFLRPDGAVSFIRGYASAFSDASGRHAGWVGSCLDLTPHRLAEQALGQERELFVAAFEHAPIGMALVDLDLRHVRVNRALCDLLQRRESDLLGRRVDDLFSPGEKQLETLPLVEGRLPVVRTERRLKRAGGAAAPTEISMTVVRDALGTPVHFVVQIEDLTARQELEQRLRARADRDALTGLLSRRRFDEELAKHLNLADRYGGRASLILIDIDNFKTINDRFGHAVGDEVLVAVASALRRRLRSTDIIGRLGGDEFVVLAPGGSEEQDGWLLAAAVHGAIRTSVHLTQTSERVTASIGVAPLGAGTSPLDAMARADRALYAAKAGGRDRYVLAGADPEPT